MDTGRQEKSAERDAKVIERGRQKRKIKRQRQEGEKRKMRNTIICSQTDICPIYKDWIKLIKAETGKPIIKENIDVIVYNIEKGDYECDAFNGIRTSIAIRNNIPQRRIHDVSAKCSLIKTINDLDKISCQSGKEVYSR